jgi:phosphoribosylformylglycinamidine synthase
VFPGPGLDIVLFGDNPGELGGSEYLKTIHGVLAGRPPVLDLQREGALQRLLVALAAAGRIRSAHDCAEGGFAVALAECCFDGNGCGADVSVGPAASDGGVDRMAATLFGESATRVIASVAPGEVAAVLALAREAGVPAERIGRTGGASIRIAVGDAGALECAVAVAEARWSGSLADWLEGRAA